MSASSELTTLGPARLSFADEAEVDRFVDMLGRFERGEISPDEWKAYRLVHGTYNQRQAEVQMIRAKIPQGVLSARQLQAIADIAQESARGFAHVTTRQNVQFHFVEPREVESVFRRLAEVGLTTREACGNAVRNVTGCPWAGVCATEPFDVTPYAEALTRHFLRHPLSSTLPRKFKIAFEGCDEDHAFVAINDLGFRAVVRAEARGFRVMAGGGTGILPTVAKELVAFLPAGEILDLTEALLQAFHRLGDREHRNRNRMKFLIRELGWDAFVAEVEKERAAIRARGGVPLPFDPEAAPEEAPPDSPATAPAVHDVSRRAASAVLRGPGILPTFHAAPPDGFASFARTNVAPQRQPGFSTVTVFLPLGDITAPQLRILSELALAYGDGTVRTTHRQDLLLRWVKSEKTAELYARLAAAFLARPGANTVVDVTSCPGAESCRLAVTHSRGLGRELADHLASRPELASIAPDLSIKMSGCPNGCGQHHVAGLGFQGSVRKVGGKSVPQYFVMVGGEVTREGASFAETAARIPARRIPEAVERLLSLYRDEREASETAPRFFRRVGVPRLKALLLDLEKLEPRDAREEDFVDFGAEVVEAAP